MHSILESDGVSSDPNEVLCHMGTLIIEGRTPRSAGETAASGESSAKSGKPYSEGPHCLNFVKSHGKDSSSAHKCTENSIYCLRYSNLKQHLQSLQQKSPSVSVEVSLGPDCLCGELRSQSTLVSGQSSKRDVILEQWTITLGHKQMREPSSTMSVMNLYQAVRSLLHFSQLTAWYMSNSGMKPAHVIYRVGAPEDSTFISDDNFVSHDFPVADVNKVVWMKISVKTLPRMEKIPSVFCPQHHETGGHSSQEPREKSYLSGGGGEALHSKFGGESKEVLLESALGLKFQGVRKKTGETQQERKRKKYITLYSAGSPLGIENCSGMEFLDGYPVEVKKMTSEGGAEEEFFTSKRTFQGDSFKSYQGGESSKAEYKKSKLSGFSGDLTELVKPQQSFESFEAFSCNYFVEQKVLDPSLDLMMKGFSDSKGKSDYRTKAKTKVSGSEGVGASSDAETKTVMDILDDRMQISCAISGKHHCKWECEEENDLSGAEENVEKPKRRRSLSKARGGADGPEDPRGESSAEKILHGKFKEMESPAPSRTPLREQEAEGPVPGCSPPKNPHPESPPKPKTTVDINSNSLAGSGENPQTPKIESLPVIPPQGGGTSGGGGPSPKEPLPLEKPGLVRTESFESFRKGCAFARDAAPDYSSESEGDFSTDEGPETANPFLAAILRTTRRKPKPNNCDSSVTKRGAGKGEDVGGRSREETGRSPRARVKNLDLRKKSSRWRESGGGGDPPGELLPKSLGRLKSLFDGRDLRGEGGASSGFEDLSSTRTIPVPSAHDKLKFRRSLDSAAQLVFHRCSGLPLTSSPAPVRRHNSSFSFDSTLNSVSAIKSALFEPSNSLSSEDENESEGSLKSPASPGAWSVGSKPINYHSLSPLPLLGSFEESVLNGRLEPVSTVQGFTAELGASGSFCPRHLHLPVTVFFYTLGDNDKVSAPYLGHINLGKKGYNVPRSGTIQVTLFNPLRTVVKMFVVVYDLHDMPANSHTFLRQRTLYVPASQKESTWTDKKETPFDQEDYHKYLRYLIHLRFVSGKTGRIYLHTDIRMVIFRKADEDTATALDDGETYELRSHTHGPLNPKFSPRK